MKVQRSWFVLVGLILSCACVGAGLAQETPEQPKKGKTPEKTKTPEKAKSPVTPPAVPPEQPQATDPYAQGPLRGGEAPVRGFNPHMLGDYQGLFARRFGIVVAVQTINTFQTTFQTTTQIVTTTIPGISGQPIPVKVPVTVTTTTQTPVTLQSRMAVAVPFTSPILSLGAFKIGENESPAPEDRVFLTYNYFGDVRGPNLGASMPKSDTVTTTINGNAAIVTTHTPAFAPQINASREIFGFEKTFFNGMASVGLRAPLVQQQGDGSFTKVGNLTAILKVAIAGDPASGDVLSAGLAVTAPTGPSIATIDGDIRSTIVQPFVGYRWVEDRFFLQGFASVAVPTDSQLPTLLFNDIGVGYKVYQGTPGDAITFVSPIVEAHLTTPLTHRGLDNAIIAPDLLALVGGVHIGLYGTSTLTFGVSAPVTGPRPFDVEGIAQLNFRY